ncbi:MAG TPA: CHAP domain-containing protein [Alphaproteobacteria bacterium]|nr:CHAP domain-containing protein [Alphaproteobacteria bacterium]
MAAALVLAACSTGGPKSPGRQEVVARGALPPPTQCAIFVREISGIPLRGDAWTWWDQAAGRFDRGDTPRVSSILVLRATEQLPYGHVAIVRRIVGPREITVTHADWGNDDPTRRLVFDSMPVVDVSPANDWSELRFWNVKAKAFGKVYPAYGFIYPHSASLGATPIW